MQLGGLAGVTASTAAIGQKRVPDAAPDLSSGADLANR